MKGIMSIVGVLFTVFLVLKLTDVVDWSWWLVTAPLWVQFVIVFLANMVYQTLEDKK